MSEFPKKAEDKINAVAIALIGIVSAILIWATVVALLAYYKNTNGSLYEIREAEGNNAAVNSMKAQQSTQLKELKYQDPQKGTLARLPIDRAKALVVAAAKENKSSLVPRIGAHDVPSVPAKAGKPIEVVPGAEPADAASAGGATQGASASEADASAAQGKIVAPKGQKANVKDKKTAPSKAVKTKAPVKKIKVKPAAPAKAPVKKAPEKKIPTTEDIVKKGLKKATGNL